MTEHRPAIMAKRAMDREIQRYLRTGEHDQDFSGWPGSDYLSRVTAGKKVLKHVLAAEVRRLEAGRSLPSLPAGFDSTTLARRKVTPIAISKGWSQSGEVIVASVTQEYLARL